MNDNELRDAFAMEAMKRLIPEMIIEQDRLFGRDDEFEYAQNLALSAYRIADEMMKARGRSASNQDQNKSVFHPAA